MCHDQDSVFKMDVFGGAGYMWRARVPLKGFIMVGLQFLEHCTEGVFWRWQNARTINGKTPSLNIGSSQFICLHMSSTLLL